ncbi:MAG: ABC transporter, substrate-binding protein (cluster 1, maltose/g3p/polyamine/iron) [uncultured Microvirga sp.]|uniref:ABC transporter, substrate-binding protein (Cluster 1, maltose/g3p/polyamine/iron) n=1 Tax=uncultured Microvirga sp. TaxID=412392 RepID=A0A6J4KPI6_9HYPH|nr:MAG: ABC transporter, substrate-binding protein (cluster 1, maltose/g3p/polyamine/iron) [uncultured Microvirga sp.]
MTKLHHPTRRAVLAGSAAATGLGLAGWPERAAAQAKGRIVVGTWGGDYARLLTKNVEQPILIKEGWEVVQDQAGDPQRRSKILAEQRLPRGSTDVQGLSALNMFQMHDAGTVLPIDYGRLKNAANLLPSMKYPWGVGHIYSGKVAVYNPKMINPAPASYKDVFDPRHGDKLGIIDIQYQYTLVCAALAAGGTVSNLEPGQKRLLECKKAGMRIYPTNEAFAQGLKAEEFGVGVMWKARVVQWQNAGISVESVAPAEGALPYVSGFVIPKNAPNKEGAYAYLDAMLAKDAQEAFAIDMGYSPTVNNATVAPDLNTRIGFTPEEVKKLAELDYDYMNKNDTALKEWWDKELKS